jgi:hypothetical protein
MKTSASFALAASAPAPQTPETVSAADLLAAGFAQLANGAVRRGRNR